jgi:hypothetical protein
MELIVTPDVHVDPRGCLFISDRREAGESREIFLETAAFLSGLLNAKRAPNRGLRSMQRVQR